MQRCSGDQFSEHEANATLAILLDSQRMDFQYYFRCFQMLGHIHYVQRAAYVLR